LVAARAGFERSLRHAERIGAFDPKHEKFLPSLEAISACPALAPARRKPLRFTRPATTGAQPKAAAKVWDNLRDKFPRNRTNPLK
jgi:hypothetical protein